MKCGPSAGEDDPSQTFCFNGTMVKPLKACLQILTMYWKDGKRLLKDVIWLWFQCCNLSQRLGIWTVWKRIFFKGAIWLCFMKSGSWAGCWMSRLWTDWYRKKDLDSDMLIKKKKKKHSKKQKKHYILGLKAQQHFHYSPSWPQPSDAVVCTCLKCVFHQVQARIEICFGCFLEMGSEPWFGWEDKLYAFWSRVV